ncbi:MAG: YggS family pyridoxal phosphate-dependent enzyme [Gammaproteobacteria bacterium]|nr:YggS family pyridoxal phosphate-dependent enzyme [Gammaproteobacteria bacterium]
MKLLKQRYTALRQRIRAAESRYGRTPGSVRIVGASKLQPVTALRSLAGLGQTAFGENYLQEALSKMTKLADLDLEWHFIGQIQSNKTRQIATHFDWVHGVDRLKIAERLAQHRNPTSPPLNLCIQVNLASEISKAGVPLDFDQLLQLAIQIAELPNTRLRGLMTIPPPIEGLEQQRTVLKELHAAQQQLIDEGLSLDTLSMGMSADIEAAIAEGATIVRPGTALFGPRPAL